MVRSEMNTVIIVELLFGRWRKVKFVRLLWQWCRSPLATSPRLHILAMFNDNIILAARTDPGGIGMQSQYFNFSQM